MTNPGTDPRVGARLDYDAVIATRNRPEALALSIPLLIRQTRPPRKLIVIDSSDDHGPVARTVAEAVGGWNGEVVVEPSPKGLPLQRNRGLRHVTAPVVLFPDDDSLLYRDAAEQMLAIYERDTDGAVAGVCGVEARTPPGEARVDGSYGLSSAHRREARTRRLRNRLERKISGLKPSIELGRMLMSRHPTPVWLAEMNAVPVEFMGGFRMSFRTEVIAQTGFDETLGGYALYEDIDASFTAMRAGVIVGARRAKVYHHRFPGGRPNAYNLGAIEVLNRHYVLRKHMIAAGLDQKSVGALRGALRRFVLFKFISGLPSLRTAFGRTRLKGAFVAARAVEKLWSVPKDQLSRTYTETLEAIGL